MGGFTWDQGVYVKMLPWRLGHCRWQHFRMRYFLSCGLDDVLGLLVAGDGSNSH